MNLKKTLLLAVVLAGILAYIVYVEVPGQNAELTKSVLVKDTAQEEIEKITIQQGGATYELVNKNPHKPKPHDPAEDVKDSNDEITGDAQDKTDWILSDLPDAKLDVARINGITSAISTLTSSATIDAADVESDLSLYGLSAPELVVSFQAKGETKKLIFGAQNEFAGDRYVKIEGVNDLYMVSNALFEAANKPKESLRDNTPVSFSDASVSGIEVQGASTKVSIVPNEKRQWRIQEPLPVRASTGAVYDLFRNLRNLQTLSFVDAPGDLATYGLESPKLSVTIKRGSGDLHIDIGQATEKSWLRINKTGTVYQVSGDPVVAISPEANVYRDKQQFKFDNFFAKEIQLTRADGSTLNLKKEGEAWKIGGKESDAPFVRQYIKDLSDVRAIGFPQGSLDYGFEKPFLKIIVNFSEGAEAETRTLYVGSKASEGFYASVDDKSEAFVISDDTLRSINALEERFLPVKPQKAS